MKPLKILAKLGLGGKQGLGNQYFSWLHEEDFVGIIDYIIHHIDLEGPYNVTAPVPVSNDQFMSSLRSALKVSVAVPLPQWLLEVGAFLIGTETELILKSRRVIPRKIMEAGYQFKYDGIERALNNLC